MSRIAVISILVSVMAVSCSADASDAGGDSYEGAWLLESGTLDGEPVTMVDGYPITMTIEEGTIGGTAACNGYGGEIVIDEENFEPGSLSVTEMACGEAGVMESESQYLEALARVDTIEGAEQGSLRLSGEGVDLEFTRQAPVPTADLLGTVWVLDGLVSGDAVTSVSGEPATLELFSDGSLIGSTGCRTVTGHYITTGASIEVTDMTAEGDCPEILTDQDSHVVTVLEGGFTVDIDGTRLSIDSQGGDGLTYSASS